MYRVTSIVYEKYCLLRVHLMSSFIRVPFRVFSFSCTLRLHKKIRIFLVNSVMFC